MAERALPLTAPLVRAYLDGLKDVTRRPLKSVGPPTVYMAVPDHVRVPESARREYGWLLPDMGSEFVCPLGRPGDTFWIREPARVVDVARRLARRIVRGTLRGERVVRLNYLADLKTSGWMPYPDRLVEPVVGNCVPNGVHREGARLFAELVSVGAEPVQSITEEDARREGIRQQEHAASSSMTWECYYWDRPHPGRGTVPPGNPAATPCHQTAREAYRVLWTAIYGAKSWDEGWCWRLELRRREASR